MTIFDCLDKKNYPVGVIMIVSDNLMHITATQIIAHYSVNFDQIHKSFKLLAF